MPVSVVFAFGVTTMADSAFRGAMISLSLGDFVYRFIFLEYSRHLGLRFAFSLAAMIHRFRLIGVALWLHMPAFYRREIMLDGAISLALLAHFTAGSTSASRRALHLATR